MNADVSVIVPAFRAAGTIGRALASVAAQTVRPREVVVVDDGSDDGTFEAAEACRSALGDIALILFRQENKGAGAARNRAIAGSSGEILAFLDADDEWLPAKLERSLHHMAAGGHVLVAHDGWIVEASREALNDCTARFAESRDPYVTLYRKGYIDTCTVLVRRGAVLAAGGFDETLPNAQDFEFWLALLQRPGTPFLVFPEALSRYHVVPGSIMSFTERRRLCALRIAERHVRALKARPGSAIASLAYRVLAIHYEALNVHRARRDWAAAGRILVLLPAALLGAMVRGMRGNSAPRPDFLKAYR